MSDNISLSGDVSRNFVCTWQTVMISFWTLIIIRRLTCLCRRVKLTGREAVFSGFLDSKETNDYGLLNWKGKKLSLLLILMFYWTIIIVIYWQKQKQIFVHDGQQCMALANYFLDTRPYEYYYQNYWRYPVEKYIAGYLARLESTNTVRKSWTCCTEKI